MADGSAPKPYPDSDVDLVAEEIAEAFNAGNRACTIPADFEAEAKAVLDALAEAGRLQPDGGVLTEEWAVLQRVSGGCNFHTLADVEENDGVDREQWAREYAAREGGEVQRRTTLHIVSDWLPVDGVLEDRGSDG